MVWWIIAGWLLCAAVAFGLFEEMGIKPGRKYMAAAVVTSLLAGPFVVALALGARLYH